MPEIAKPDELIQWEAEEPKVSGAEEPKVSGAEKCQKALADAKALAAAKALAEASALALVKVDPKPAEVSVPKIAAFGPNLL